MIREWADEDTHERIDEMLLPDAANLAATWDDEEAWATFESAVSAEHR